MARDVQGEAGKRLLQQPGILDFGVFIVGSSSNSGRTHWLTASLVERRREVIPSQQWAWSTVGVPAPTLQACAYWGETQVTEVCLRLYGIQGDLPY